MCAYAAMLLLRRSISFLVTSMVILTLLSSQLKNNKHTTQFLSLVYNATKHHTFRGDFEFFMYFPSTALPVSSSAQRLDVKPPEHGTFSYVFKWVGCGSECQTKAPLCPPNALASTGIIITHLAHGTLRLPFSLNRGSPL